MFLTPYETTIGSKYTNLNKIKFAIEEQKILNQTEKGIDKKFPMIEAILKKDETTKNIPNFNHPIIIKDKIFIDLRPFTNEIRENNYGDKIYPSYGSATLQLTRAKLQWIWEKNSSNYLKTFSSLPSIIFSHWMGETISRVCSLSIEASVSINILTSYYYQCLFAQDESEISSNLKELSLIISRYTRITISKVDEVLAITNGVKFNNISEFAKWLSSSGISPRLEKINGVFLINALASSWFGSTVAREIVTVGLEYPPTFIAILSQALNEKMYRKTPIGQVAERFSKQNNLTTFNNGLISLFNSIEV